MLEIIDLENKEGLTVLAELFERNISADKPNSTTGEGFNLKEIETGTQNDGKWW